MTEDTSKNQELLLKTTLRELFVYILFLVDMCLCKYEGFEYFSQQLPYMF